MVGFKDPIPAFAGMTRIDICVVIKKFQNYKFTPHMLHLNRVSLVAARLRVSS